MRRIVIVTVLFFCGVLGAQSDTDVYNNITKRERGDGVLQADTNFCAQKFGMPQNGTRTSRQFKRCMLGRGWRFDHTTREHTYIDPETGLTCRDITVFGILGSECSNF